MPTWDRFLMAFALEQFLAAFHLGVATVLLTLNHVVRRVSVTYGPELCFATIPSMSSLHTRSNNALPCPSTCSTYRILDPETFESRRLNSCLRSVNLSVRKSFPSDISRSNAKKQGSPR